jgi:uncharacterized peroxidase-related enzyme
VTPIETVPEPEAAGAVAEMYEGARQTFGGVPNFAKAFSLHPEVYAAWVQLNGAIKSTMDVRRYELATVAAARRLRSSYCTLAHGSVLVDRFLEPETVRALVEDPRTAGLGPVDLAVFELADKVARDAGEVDDADLDRLRELGLQDAEILDIVLAAAARSFFSKALDALGAQPDARYSELEPGLRDTLTVGRPIASGGGSTA